MTFEYSDTEFIKLNRKILEWGWFSDVCTRDVFIYCLLKANWKPGKWHGIEYKRGEFITSLPTISEDLGFSMMNVRTALKHLKSTGETIGPVEIYKRDVNWINECDILIAEVTVPSLGVGYEIGYAESLNKKIICLYQANENLSAMIKGNENITQISYNNIDELLTELSVYFK